GEQRRRPQVRRHLVGDPEATAGALGRCRRGGVRGRRTAAGGSHVLGPRRAVPVALERGVLWVGIPVRGRAHGLTMPRTPRATSCTPRPRRPGPSLAGG